MLQICKRFIVMFVMSFILLTCIGCASQEQQKTIHLLSWGYEDSRYLGLEKVVEEFNQSSKNVKYELKVERYTDGNWNWQKYLDLFETSKPDLIIINSDVMGRLAAEGYLEPLDSIVQQDMFQKEYLSPLLPSTMYNGHNWGLLIDSDVSMVFVNRAMLQELGYTEQQIKNFPKSIRTGEITMNDLVQISEIAVKRNICDYSMVHRPAGGVYFYMMADQFDAFRILPNGEIYFSEENMEKMLAFFQHTVNTSVNTIPDTWNAVNDVFINGDAAVFFGNCWSIYDCITEKGANAEDLENQYVATLIPGIQKEDNPFTISNSMLITLSADSKNKEDIKKILSMAYSDWDACATHAAQTYHMPVSRTSVNSTFFQNNKFLVGNLYMMDYTNFAPNSPEIYIWRDALFQAVKSVENGSGTPKEVAHMFAQDLADRVDPSARNNN